MRGLGLDVGESAVDGMASVVTDGCRSWEGAMSS